MTRDEEAPDPSLFDRRIVERNIKRGLITRKDYEKFLKSLSDASDKIKSPDDAPEPSSSPAGTGTPSPTTPREPV
jgi:hypothetical protein